MSAPAISTPVGPPPTMTKVSAPASSAGGSTSAASNCRRMWRAQLDRVGDGLQREGVLVHARARRTSSYTAPGASTSRSKGTVALRR